MTGFLLIDTFGHQGGDPAAGNDHGLRRDALGSVWHAVWAGIPLGLCVLAFTPPAFVDAIGKVFPLRQGGVVSRRSASDGAFANNSAIPMTRKSEFVWVDESKYYYIKVENEVEDDGAIPRNAPWCSTT